MPEASLILAEQDRAVTAPFLFCGEEMERLEKRGEFTGERLFSQKPETYREVVRLIAEGSPMRQIAALCKVSINTVAAVRDREKIPIETQKQEILRSIRTGMKLTVERVIELAPSMNGKDAVIAFGILTEKGQLLSGEATDIVRKETLVVHADINAILESLPVAEADKTGPSGGAGGQKGEVFEGEFEVVDESNSEPDSDTVSMSSSGCGNRG